MTNFEYSLLRIFNTIDISFAYKVSDTFVNFTPEIKSEIPKINFDTYKSLLNKYQPLINEINENLPPNEKIEFDYEGIFLKDDSSSEAIGDEQLQLFYSLFNRHFILTKEIQVFVNTIRDIALKIEAGNECIDLSDALELMKIARHLRPDGPLINQKVDDWIDRLNTSSN